MEKSQKKTMTKDEMIQELMELLKANSMQKQSNDVYELCAYIDGLEQKLDFMSENIKSLEKQIQKMQEDSSINPLKEKLIETHNKMEATHIYLAEQMRTLKSNVKDTAKSIVQETREKGKLALCRISELIGAEKHLKRMREKVTLEIKTTDQAMERIHSFTTGIKDANHLAANAFRTFAGKTEVDYSKKAEKHAIEDAMLSGWKVHKKLCQKVLLHLDASIDKVHDIFMDVQLQNMMKKWDNVMETGNKSLAMVAENKQEYGADKFEACEKNIIIEEKKIDGFEKSR